MSERKIEWNGLSDTEKARFVDELCALGTEFVTPLFAVIDNVEKTLRERNSPPDADCWILWSGGECPLKADTKVNLKHRNGDVSFNELADDWDWTHGDRWSKTTYNDIIAYRVAGNQNDSK